MTYTLAIGDRTYSSWSLRGWLLFAAFDVPVTTRFAPMRTDDFVKMLEEFAPSRTVPSLKIGDDVVIWDSLAMAEALAERHPEVAYWPADPVARGIARSITAEMHSSFTALRGACPMNLEHQWQEFEPDEGVLADLARLEACLLYTSPSPRDQRGSRMPSSA